LQDAGGLFEEQTVVASLEHVGIMPHAGSIAAAESSSAADGAEGAGASNIRRYYRTRPAYALADRVFHFGHVVPGLFPKGVTERVRLTNPTKIPVILALAVKTDDGSTAFTVSPPTLDIPPHESRFAELTFMPSGMRRITGVFVGEVEGGTLPDTRRVEFGLLGEGALPAVALVQVCAVLFSV
jgi:hypothetical protein